MPWMQLITGALSQGQGASAQFQQLTAQTSAQFEEARSRRTMLLVGGTVLVGGFLAILAFRK